MGLLLTKSMKRQHLKCQYRITKSMKRQPLKRQYRIMIWCLVKTRIRMIVFFNRWSPNMNSKEWKRNAHERRHWRRSYCLENFLNLLLLLSRKIITFVIVRSEMAVRECGFLFFQQNCHQPWPPCWNKCFLNPYQRGQHTNCALFSWSNSRLQ